MITLLRTISSFVLLFVGIGALITGHLPVWLALILCTVGTILAPGKVKRGADGGNSFTDYIYYGVDISNYGYRDSCEKQGSHGNYHCYDEVKNSPDD